MKKQKLQIGIGPIPLGKIKQVLSALSERGEIVPELDINAFKPYLTKNGNRWYWTESKSGLALTSVDVFLKGKV